MILMGLGGEEPQRFDQGFVISRLVPGITDGDPSMHESLHNILIVHELSF